MRVSFLSGLAIAGLLVSVTACSTLQNAVSDISNVQSDIDLAQKALDGAEKLVNVYLNLPDCSVTVKHFCGQPAHKAAVIAWEKKAEDLLAQAKANQVAISVVFDAVKSITGSLTSDTMTRT